MLSLLILVVLAALLFDFINGFHDTANAIATSVSTGVLTVRSGVIMAGVLNFAGAMTGTAVAGFIANKLVSDPQLVTQQVVLAALLGATVWNLITWWLGIPSSSSHALIGGLAGAVVAHNGVNAVQWHALEDMVLLPLVVSPLLGFLAAFILMLASLWMLRRRRPATVHVLSRYMQLISAGTLSFSHGCNDAQKAMGVITLALVAWMGAHGITPLLELPAGPIGPDLVADIGTATRLPASSLQGLNRDQLEATLRKNHMQQLAVSGMSDAVRHQASWLLPSTHLDHAGRPGHAAHGAADVPVWVIIACALAMALGTMAGGKKIIKTMGSKIIKISPLQGFAAQSSGTVVILAASHLGIPVSTTHAISASVMGAGLTKGAAAVRWGMARSIVTAWVLTLPASAAVAYLILICLRSVFGAS